ncbi:MAG TPA: c-type cytochrome [Desulfobacteraceae bacterium]|nr:c-type cytochrome [Desulfobacteraceae bacterium]
MKMTPAILILGSLLVYWASMSVLVIMPMLTLNIEPSEIWRPMTGKEKEGYELFVRNGCTYCHTQFVRVMDWGAGAERIAQAGDYVHRSPALMGTKRTGPDLSQQGGEHPDDWHMAHFHNPRFTSPVSVMPSFSYLGEENIDKLIAFVQFEGMKAADERVARQRYWKEVAVEMFHSGTDRNIEWLHQMVPEVWRKMPNPYPPLEANLERGRKIYQQFCMGCHGVIGDGQGPAAEYLEPRPLNFTSLRRHLEEGRYIGGILYYQIMNGVTGTAMPYFKKALESAKIWDVANYVAVSFIGYSDADIEPGGIDASYEPEYRNSYEPPDEKGLPDGKDFIRK